MRSINKYNDAFYSITRNARKNAYVGDTSSHWFEDNSESTDKEIKEVLVDLAEQYFEDTKQVLHWSLVEVEGRRAVYMRSRMNENIAITNRHLKEFFTYLYVTTIPTPTIEVGNGIINLPMLASAHLDEALHFAGINMSWVINRN